MPINKVKALKAVTRQRFYIVLNECNQRTGPQADAAWKGQVVQSHSNIDSRANQRASRFANAFGNGLSADGVSANEAAGAVLLRRANREDNAARSR